MAQANRIHEIDHHTLKFIVGLIAIGLAHLTNQLAGGDLPSISASYHQGGWPRNVFVGSLCIIGAFLFAYNGESLTQMLLSKIAALAALGIALFPCECGMAAGIPQCAWDVREAPSHIHGICAAIMFLVLAIFCVIFYQRARAKGHREANWRAVIYALCAVAIIVVIATLAFDHFSGGVIRAKDPHLTFHGEYAGLVAFGIAWLVASRALPVITSREERVSILPSRSMAP